MKYVKLGRTGMDVSEICLGCMSFGVPEKGNAPWSLNEKESRVIIKKSLEFGINFFDTANVYSAGTSEEIVGRALKDYARRDEIVIATKVHSRMHDGPNGMGLSRKAIMSEIDNSLRRLGVDYVDLYQTHRWDNNTPIEETLEALHDVVKAGKARYIGASSMAAWHFQKAQHVAEMNGWTRFVSMQNLLNLLYREEEREMIPYCEDTGVALIPWSPLARGVLTRKWDSATQRSQTDERVGLFTDANAEDQLIVERVAELAETHNVSKAQIALAWVLQNPLVTAPIVGFSKLSHLDDAISALDVKLTTDEITYLEELYRPHEVTGYSK